MGKGNMAGNQRKKWRNNCRHTKRLPEGTVNPQKTARRTMEQGNMERNGAGCLPLHRIPVERDTEGSLRRMPNRLGTLSGLDLMDEGSEEEDGNWMEDM